MNLERLAQVRLDFYKNHSPVLPPCFKFAYCFNLSETSEGNCSNNENIYASLKIHREYDSQEIIQPAQFRTSVCFILLSVCALLLLGQVLFQDLLETWTKVWRGSASQLIKVVHRYPLGKAETGCRSRQSKRIKANSMSQYKRKHQQLCQMGIISSNIHIYTWGQILNWYKSNAQQLAWLNWNPVLTTMLALGHTWLHLTTVTFSKCLTKGPNSLV